MSYITFDELKGLVPDGWVTAALDDDGDGNAEKFETVRDLAEREVNGVVGLRYAVPVVPTPPILGTIAVYIAAEIVYGRRGMSENFPYKDAVAVYRRQLRDIGAGDLPLGPEQNRKKSSVTVITEESRLHSSHMNF